MEYTNHGIGKRVLTILLTAVMALSLCAAVTETRAETTYTVTFDANGGTFPEFYGDENTFSVQVTAGETTVFPFASRTGGSGYYGLMGWKADEDDEVYVAGTKTPAVLGNITYKAQWSPKSSSAGIKITFSDLGETGKELICYTTKAGTLKIPENLFWPSAK